VRYLLDTCTLLWFLSDSKMMSKPAREIISNDSSSLGVSIVSLWEITIKTGIGKLSISSTLAELWQFASREDIEILPMSLTILETLQTLPLHHSDPFDRTIIATALDGNWAILTPDTLFDSYGATRIW
jgi:PIN domain nuclease of toxin-antitoxin system